MSAKERAIMLLNIAAKYLRENEYVDALTVYDDTECDGLCLADDLEQAAIELARGIE